MMKDSNWSQIKETMSMLYLSAAQIESSMREGTQAVHELTDALVSISSASQKINDSIVDLEIADLDESSLQDAKASNDDISQHIKDSVVACQFHDRISQRLEHVTGSLSRVCELIAMPDSYDDPEAWRSLQEEIRSGYTMESEKIMFEHIMMGMSVKEALEIYHHEFQKEEASAADSSDDEIELF